MFFYLVSCIVSSGSAFLYPAYASYKTLSQRPASEEELERWLMYWSVLGCVVAVEYVAEWVVSWVPFYYTLKTIFLLYLALPQTQGSTYIYLSHLHPFFSTHEAQIDATLASLKARAKAFLQERLRLLWEGVAAAIGQQSQQQATPFSEDVAQSAATPSAATPGGPAQLLGSLWTSYGPGIMASGTALLWQSAARLPTGPGATIGASPQLNIRGSPDSIRSRERTNSGRFEEIEVPSDVEGYDVGDEDGVGYARRPGQQQRKGSGWFGGWGSGAKGDYERVKSD
ncbi:hypothetical protein FA13DRAFT_1763783 [Coprinellus micaceus]|uniref:Protein YOP1 n=1 Tax=Coprinellus micaceus TaxID=71717 RepID=A0A4Y7TEU1_COPMI|nr:hypothetical protein FA13DRAFT_1763783 [Coprinellus micaceus]